MTAPTPTPRPPLPAGPRRRARTWLLRLLLGLGSLLPALPAAHAEGTDTAPATIEWYMIDLPPIQIASGELRGQGYSDNIRWRLIAGLPEYRHVLRVANVERILADIASKPNVCNPSFLRTPKREGFMVFAEPLHLQFPNGAVILKERREEFESFVDPDGALDVGALLAHDKGNLVIQSGRAYGNLLDELIEQARRDHHLVTLSGNQPVESKLGLLQKGRAAVALLYPYELTYYISNPEERARYEFLPVTGEGAYTLNHLACSRSPLGEEVVARANAVIARERNGSFSAAYRGWLPTTTLARHEFHHWQAFGAPLQADAPVRRPGDELIANCLMSGGAWFRGQCDKAAPASATH